MKKLILMSFLSLPINAMCEFPHNPPILCVEGDMVKTKKVTKKPFQCLITLKVVQVIRPIPTWKINKNLDKILFSKPKSLALKNLNFYSKKKCPPKETIKRMLRYNCSDKYSSLKDMALYELKDLKGYVSEDWEEKKVFINCESHLSQSL